MLAGAALALVLYLRAWSRLRRRGRRDRASIGRLLLFSGGIALAVLALISPVDPIGEQYLLSVHMLQHVHARRRRPRADPARPARPAQPADRPAAACCDASRASTWLRRAASTLLRPAVALGLWAIVYAGWHLPRAYDYALSHQLVHDLEHISFLFVGLPRLDAADRALPPSAQQPAHSHPRGALAVRARHGARRYPDPHAAHDLSPVRRAARPARGASPR